LTVFSNYKTGLLKKSVIVLLFATIGLTFFFPTVFILSFYFSSYFYFSGIIYFYYFYYFYVLFNSSEGLGLGLGFGFFAVFDIFFFPFFGVF
jgi:hypothetical protein